MVQVHIENEHWEDDDDDFDCCEHGVGFDCACAGCEDDPIGCCFPGKCLMPGEHLESECHTVEMLEGSINER